LGSAFVRNSARIGEAVARYDDGRLASAREESPEGGDSLDALAGFAALAGFGGFTFFFPGARRMPIMRPSIRGSVSAVAMSFNA